MNGIIQDVRYGLRNFLKAPGFTAIAVMTLALGLGANTAIFSVINAVIFRPLPYSKPEELVQCGWMWARGETQGMTTTKFEFWTQHSRSFAITSAYAGGFGGFNLIGGPEPLRVNGLRVDANFLPMLGVRTAQGRFFSKEEDTRNGPRALVISDALWRGYFGSDPEILKRVAVLDGLDYAIVGVLPADFHFEGAGDVLVPLRMVANPNDQGHNTAMLARLAPGVSIEQAQADVAQLLPRFREAVPKHAGAKDRGVRVTPLQSAVTGSSRQTLLMLFGAVGLVLLIACANVANLLLARASKRSGELAIRTALGASRARLVRQLMVENLMLALAGCAAGYLVAMWTVPMLLAAMPPGLPRLTEVQVDAQAAGFALLVAAATSVLFGAAPAWRAARVDLNETLKASSGKSSAGRALLNARSALVVGEVALALMLLVGAGLFLRSFTALNSVTVGFEPQNVTALQISLTSERYRSTASSWEFQRQLIERIRAIPGVEAVGAVPGLPLERGLNTYVTIPNRAEPTGRSVEMRAISPDYFRALQIPVLRGRALGEGDAQAGVKSIVVNSAFAKLFWEGDAVGQLVQMDEGAPHQIVGVVGDVREIGYRFAAAPTVYQHAATVNDALTRATNQWFDASWLVRTAGPVDLNVALRDAVRSLDAQLPVAKIRALPDVMGASLGRDRFLLTLMSVFAALALALTCIGIFSVLNYQVTQRTQEIGIRMALGAARGDVLAMVMRQGMLLAALGLTIGIGGAASASNVVKSFLFQVKPTDPATYVAVGALLAVVAAVACWLPARRATRVDPIVALRHE